MARTEEAGAGAQLDLDYQPAWLPWALFLLSLVGLGVSIYLFYAHLNTPAVLACPENATINCAKVTTSPESYFLHIPVSLLGLVFFVAFSVVNYPRFAANRALGMLRLAMSLGSMVFVLWLVYAELLIVGAICLYCSLVHLITLIIFLLVVYSSTQTGLFSRRA